MAEKIKRDYITYKDLDKIIDKYDHQYIMLISGRNDGKSYAVNERYDKKREDQSNGRKD